jgi:hypothetical protein
MAATIDGQAEMINAELISGNAFQSLGSSPDRHPTEILFTLLLRLFRSGCALSQKGPLESIFTAVAIVVLLLASPVIGIELGRVLGPMLR